MAHYVASARMARKRLKLEEGRKKNGIERRIEEVKVSEEAKDSGKDGVEDEEDGGGGGSGAGKKK